jgi:hypothetical protein
MRVENTPKTESQRKIREVNTEPNKQDKTVASFFLVQDDINTVFARLRIEEGGEHIDKVPKQQSCSERKNTMAKQEKEYWKSDMINTETCTSSCVIAVIGPPLPAASCKLQ